MRWPVVLILAGDVQNAAGNPWTDSAAVKNVLTEAMSQRRDTYTSMTWPRWSTAR
jgi:hypothetical protein